MNELVKVTLINSADYGLGEFDFRGNTLLTGTNGAGKTTLIRAGLFFYYPKLDKADLGIQAQKRSFADYYLPLDIPNAYVVYQYNNQNGKNMVVMFREESEKKMRFKFFSFDEMQSIVIQDIFFDGHVAKLPSELFSSLRTLATSESSNVSAATKFERIIYGTIEDPDLRKYSPFQGKNTSRGTTNLVGKTIRNIFVNNRISSESIKSILTSAIDNTGTSGFRLSKFREDTKNIILRKEDIETVEKKRPIAEEIVTLHDTVKNTLEILAGTAISIKMRYVHVKRELESLYAQKKGIEDDIEQATKKKEEKETIHKALDNQEAKKEGVLEQQLKDAEQKREEYQEKDIDSKSKELSQLESLEETHASLSKQILLLESRAEDLTHKLKQEVETSRQRLKNISLKEAQESLTVERLHTNELEVVLQKIQDAYDVEMETFAQAEKELSEGHRILSENNIAKNNEFSKVTYASHETEEMKNVQSKINILSGQKRTLEEEDGELNSSMSERTQALKDAETEEDKVVTAEQNAADKKKAPLISEVEKVENLLKYDAGTVIDFILKNDIPQKDKVLSMLRDEVLLKKDAEPAYSGETTTTFHGLSLKNIEIRDIGYWENEKRRLKEEVQAIDAQLEKDIKKIQDELADKKAKIERDRSKINKRLGEVASEISIATSSILVNTNTFEGLGIKAKEKKAAELRELKEELHAIEVEKNKLKLAENELKKKKTGTKNLLEQTKAAAKDEVSRKKNVAILEIKENYKKQEKRISDEIEAQNKNIEDIQIREGVDVETIKNLKIKESAALSDIQRVKGFEGEVRLYLEYKKAYIDKIGDIAKALEDIRQKNKVASQTREAEISVLKKEIEKIASANMLLKGKIDKFLNEDIKRYEELMSATIETSSVLAFAGRKITAAEDLDTIEHVESYEKSAGESEYRRLTVSQLIARLEEAENEKIDAERLLGYRINNFFAGIRDFDFFGLEKTNMEKSGDEENMRVAQSVKAFIDKGYTDMVIVELVRLLMLHLSDTSNQIRILEDKLEDIRKYLRKIRTQLRSVTGISVIKSIEIEMPNEDIVKGYQSDSSEVLKLLKRLKIEFEERDRIFVGQGLFEHHYNQENGKPNPEEDRKLIRLLGNINEKLETSKNEELTLEDCFDIRFRVVENNNDSGWQTSLNGIGSEGTDALVKMLINISFLDILKRETIGEARIHCMIDEIGKLSEGYFKEVIDFGNKRGISFVNALPAKMLVSTHKSVYKLEKKGSGNITVPYLLVGRESMVRDDEVTANA